MAFLPSGLGRLDGLDVRRSPHLLASVREAALAGSVPPEEPRTVIGQSWTRALGHGVDPDVGGHNGLIATEEIEHRRRSSPLGDLLPVLREGLVSVADAAWHIMVVTDADGRLLWRDGSLAVRRSADRLGFAEGASWAEEVVGTNAIGTALITRSPLQVHSAEHFVRTHHGWTCAAAPLHDPRDGRLLGVVDVSGPAATLHPATLSLVAAVARVAEGELRSRHWAAVEGLRAMAAPILARIGGQALAVDRNGWTAAVTGMAPPDRVALPASMGAGPLWLPSLGMCTAEPLPGGWLIRVDGGERAPDAGRVVLDVSRPRSASLTVSGPAGSWTQTLSPRHAELLFVLAVHRDGRSAAELAGDLFGDPSRTVTVRAELSRLRRSLAGVLAHRPYRFADGVDVALVRPENPLDLLPHSVAPVVLAARR
ncbi:GAF domain-containing protein [Actinacidiphila rubida]|uniref:GAF domain-containing protein n=1 Tax=Actinacidiphila rubida TaxID=310780 RepID=A0A1H8FPN4_9ACTN|nr:GAF domain-containing protein [Actinacidiphila rubida]SEN33545.1 GAF domain-containing protein [Actinacidiphila rubida]